MGKVGKKLIVYLDQNFISDIAKLKINDKVRKEFKELFDVLHEGFLSEKLVVPVSWFHKIETCLKPDLKEHIENYQAWMGQVDLRSKDHVYCAQLGRSLRMYKSNLQEDMDYFEAFSENPDHPLQSFRVSVDPGLEKIYNVKDRKQLSLQIEENKNRSICEGTNFIQQKKLEIEAYANGLLNNHPFGFSFLRLENEDILQSFVKSEFFESIPIVDIGSAMWARIIVGHPHRQVQDGDSTDVDIVATYMPYVDVIALDKFMANNVRFLELDKIYKAHVFDSSTSGLQDLINFIRNYVEKSEPVNKKDVAIFVLSDKKIKDESISFFQNLDNQCKKYHIDLYGFDDGEMPKYRYEKIWEEAVDETFGDTDEVKEEEVVIEKNMSDTVELATLSLKITGYEEKNAVTSKFGSATPAKEDAKFVVVYGEVINTIKETFDFFPGMTLLDGEGREFETYDDTIGAIDNFLNVRELSPGIKEEGVLLFQVPESAQNFKLIARKKGSDKAFHIQLEKR